MLFIHPWSGFLLPIFYDRVKVVHCSFRAESRQCSIRLAVARLPVDPVFLSSSSPPFVFLAASFAQSCVHHFHLCEAALRLLCALCSLRRPPSSVLFAPSSVQIRSSILFRPMLALSTVVVSPFIPCHSFPYDFRHPRVDVHSTGSPAFLFCIDRVSRSVKPSRKS